MSENQQSTPENNQRTEQFVRLLSQYERQVKGYILSLVPHWADADEISQETNVRLWQQFDSYDPSLNFGSWACTIAHYQVLTHRKQASRQQLHFSERFDQLVTSEITKMSSESTARHHALQDCLDKLDDDHRVNIQQYYAGDVTVNQLAADAGRTESAIYKSLTTIRRILHDCVERTLRGQKS